MRRHTPVLVCHVIVPYLAVIGLSSSRIIVKRKGDQPRPIKLTGNAAATHQIQQRSKSAIRYGTLPSSFACFEMLYCVEKL
jgi:hypothetical protein